MNSRHIYFIEAVGLRRIKIGLAAAPERRLRELQTASPAPLTLLATLASDDASACEAWLHRRFSDDRLHGEWFRATPTLRRLARYLSGWPMRARFDEPGRDAPAIHADAQPGRDARDLVKHVWHVADVLHWMPKMVLPATTIATAVQG